MKHGNVYFGTRDLMMEIPAPKAGADFSAAAFSTESQLLGGGAFVAGSKASHKVYNLSWDLKPRAALAPVLDFRDGVFGDGLIYWLDPMVMDRNVLPVALSVPSLKDAMPLVKNKPPVRVATPANTYRYPVKSAKYTMANGDTAATVWVPIPPGYTMHFGWHGFSQTVTKVIVTPFNLSGVAQAVQSPAMLGVATSQLTNATFNGDNYSGVEISMSGVGNVTIAGLIAQILLTGRPAPTGSFIVGRGNSGCEFSGVPTENDQSAALDLMGLSAKLIETGWWK